MNPLEFVIHAWGMAPTHQRDDSLAAVPKMLKRRLTPLARTVFSAIHRCGLTNSDILMVFSSNHGELAKSFQMMEQLEAGEEISPTHFSLSVHNAIAGLFSMAYHNQQECSVIAPGMEGVAAGFIEATGLLQEGYREVLLVFYDEPLVDFYPAMPFRLSAPEMALALRLGLHGEGEKISLSYAICDHETNDGEQALQLPLLAEFLTSFEKDLTIKTPTKSWHWQRYD
jgi:hypothetical protein